MTCICDKAQNCPRDYQENHACRHAKPHQNNLRPGTAVNCQVTNCQVTPCYRGGLCSPLNLVHVSNEHELPPIST